MDNGQHNRAKGVAVSLWFHEFRPETPSFYREPENVAGLDRLWLISGWVSVVRDVRLERLECYVLIENQLIACGLACWNNTRGIITIESTTPAIDYEENKSLSKANLFEFTLKAFEGYSFLTLDYRVGIVCIE